MKITFQLQHPASKLPVAERICLQSRLKPVDVKSQLESVSPPHLQAGDIQRIWKSRRRPQRGQRSWCFQQAENSGESRADSAHGMQNEALKKAKPMVVVGTAGRIAELSRSGQLQMHQTGILVLDEVRRACSSRLRAMHILILNTIPGLSRPKPAVLTNTILMS